MTTTHALPGDPVAAGRPYRMRISRLTIDKLGVKLYDSVSAVVAELVANAYDADAETVTVRLPLGSLLTRKGADGTTEDFGVVEVEDDGHGMCPPEAIEYYLVVGRDRRKQQTQGARSRQKARAVMGRKGIGKLAPFGICRQIEVLSAGGPRTEQGYVVTHFFMNFDDIQTDTDTDVPLTHGPEDRTYRARSGTTIRLSRFLPKRVPDAVTFHRQLARRFVVTRPDFKIIVEDTRAPQENPPTEVGPLSVPVQEGTRIDVSEHPLLTEDNRHLPVTGWMAHAKEPYKNEEMTGVRIYTRGKFVAATRDFEQPAGFTGEFAIRSYLVGEIEAEWLDADDGEDLIRTDRQSILWDSDDGRAFREWGAKLIREIARKGREPQRKRVRETFLQKSDIVKHAKQRFRDSEVIKAAVELAEKIGSFAAEDELGDDQYVLDLREVILSVAPHKALVEAFQEFNRATSGRAATLEDLQGLFGKARIAEMASYGQIAAERVRAIQQLEKIVRNTSDEAQLQELLAEAPWLVEPTWSVISMNQGLKHVRNALEAYLKKRVGREVKLALSQDRKRPDFTLVATGYRLNLVEIKAAGHKFNDEDFKRLINYVDAFDDFFEANPEAKREFPAGYQVLLVADGERLTNASHKAAFRGIKSEGKIRRITWEEFLGRAQVSHEQFLKVAEGAARRREDMGLTDMDEAPVETPKVRRMPPPRVLPSRPEHSPGGRGRGGKTPRR